MRVFILIAILSYMSHIGAIIFDSGPGDVTLVILILLVCIAQDIKEIFGKK